MAFENVLVRFIWDGNATGRLEAIPFRRLEGTSRVLGFHRGTRRKLSGNESGIGREEIGRGPRQEHGFLRG